APGTRYLDNYADHVHQIHDHTDDLRAGLQIFNHLVPASETRFELLLDPLAEGLEYFVQSLQPLGYRLLDLIGEVLNNLVDYAVEACCEDAVYRRQQLFEADLQRCHDYFDDFGLPAKTRRVRGLHLLVKATKFLSY